MSPENTLRIALQRAREYAKAPRLVEARHCNGDRSYRYHVAMGDAQASLARALSVLCAYGLIGNDGHLRQDVHLVCTGDYFDFGSVADRVQAGSDGTAFLAWLAAHPQDQIDILLGNHDFARVGEFVHYDDRLFEEAFATARSIEQNELDDACMRGTNSEEFSRVNPDLPSFEYASRYYACFQKSQRDLVTLLLREQRCILAYAHGSKILCTHAGVTQEQLHRLSSDRTLQSDAQIAAELLNRALATAVCRWEGDAPLHIEGLHRVGNAATGPSGGMLNHRPCNPESFDAEVWRQKQRAGRLYDARMVPDFLQVCGHVRDAECIERFGSWSRVTKPQSGVLRHLAIPEEEPVYDHGIASEARMVFIDGQLHAGGHYSLFDLEGLAPFEAIASLEN